MLAVAGIKANFPKRGKEEDVGREILLWMKKRKTRYSKPKTERKKEREKNDNDEAATASAAAAAAAAEPLSYRISGISAYSA